jgi:hypothetical protein
MRRENELEKDPAPLPKELRQRASYVRDNMNHHRGHLSLYLREDLIARLKAGSKWHSVSAQVERLLLAALEM